MKAKLLAITLAVVSLQAVQAQTYQWKDASGRTIISDTPPPASVRETRAIGQRMPTMATEGAGDKATAEKPAAAPTLAEKELEFRKRQQEQREKADKQAQEAATRRERQETCQRARANLAALTSDQAVSQFDQRGERRVLEGAQRRQEIERTRRIMEEACR